MGKSTGNHGFYHEIYRKAPYFMVKTMVSGEDFPLNQPNDFFC
jgi:hypothetical protein